MARHRRGLVLAVFVTCGTVGHSIGPVFFSRMTEWLGLGMLYWAALPGLIVSGILLWGLPARAAGAAPAESRFDYKALRAKWKPLLLHYSLVLLRSIVQVGHGTVHDALSVHGTGVELSSRQPWTDRVFCQPALWGSLVGGSLADRFGSRRIVVLSMIVSIPFLATVCRHHGLGFFPGLVCGRIYTASDEPRHSWDGARAGSHPGEHRKRVDHGFCLGSRRPWFSSRSSVCSPTTSVCNLCSGGSRCCRCWASR